jgi:ABC-type molybdate transport system substrate-binding protein
MPISTWEGVMRRRAVLGLAIVVAVVFAGCASDDKAAPAASSSSKPDNLVTVTVTPDLEDIVTQVIHAYEKDDPSLQFQVFTHTHDGITEAVANKKTDVAVLPALWLLEPASKGLTTGRFGRNLAVIAVPTGNPRHVTDTRVFAAGSRVRTAVCAVDTAQGNFGLYVLAKAGVKPDPATVASGCDAKALQQLVDGTLDAVLLFRNGLTVPNGVTLLDIADDQNVVIDLSYVVMGTSSATAKFGAFLSSDAVRALLTQSGYLP